ncbi:MarR family winged helix-turn-helix transcriptional regulator [Streptomyces sp. NPDC058676]|uniref:MarR family winged helix-turn-helix transcriptional regulator n=1 Tax=unclassified Streptomyces TaxID=2593676 RepID=UPI003652D534
MSSTAPEGGSPPAEGYHAHAGHAAGDDERAAALQGVMTGARELGLATIALNSAVARSMKVHPTDAWILSYMRNLPPESPLTPGDLARVTGLTTGAITGVIDRLESQQYVRRERDPHDRRKVIIAPTEASAKVVGVFRPLVEKCMGLAMDYSTEELTVIGSYFEGIVTATEEAVARLRTV